MQSSLILVVNSVTLKTNSATEVPVKKNKSLNLICRFKLPNETVPYTNLYSEQWETTISLQLNT